MRDLKKRETLVLDVRCYAPLEELGEAYSTNPPDGEKLKELHGPIACYASGIISTWCVGCDCAHV